MIDYVMLWLNPFAPKGTLYLDTAINAAWPIVETADTELPYMVRLAWGLEAPSGELVRYASHLIRMPHGASMDGATASSVLIFDGMLAARGMPLGDVLVEFVEALADAGTIVAHNWRRQEKVLDRSLRYVGMTADRWRRKRAVCTMRAGAALVGISSPGILEPKWPTFQEMTAYTLGGAPPADADPHKEGTKRVETLRVFHNLLVRHGNRQTA